jgi:hypothetical protein
VGSSPAVHRLGTGRAVAGQPGTSNCLPHRVNSGLPGAVDRAGTRARAPRGRPSRAWIPPVIRSSGGRGAHVARPPRAVASTDAR